MSKPEQGSSVAAAEPAWEVARLFPNQGEWTEEEYLALNTNRLVEFSDGVVEVLPMPTLSHQLILAFLFEALKAHVTPRGLGTVILAGYRVKLPSNKFREPDLLFVSKEHEPRMGQQFTEAADLVMEVVSDDDRRRDLEIKRSEYAQAGIPEYWIVDPQLGRITVLTLDGSAYAVHGEFPKGTQARSRLLPGLNVDVTGTFAASR